MKAKEIQELIQFLSESGLEEVNIETSEIKINIRRSLKPKIYNASTSQIPATTINPGLLPIQAPNPPPVENSKTTTKESLSEKNSDDENKKYIEIKSPMIGTFYRSPNPESPPFVEVGSKIKLGDPICIVEAMKLFNEIESEVAGTIVKVLLDNSQPVEFDQPLFLVEP